MAIYYTLGFVALTALAVHGQAGLYSQCGGKSWTGPTYCVTGAVCTYENDWYSQCRPGTDTISPTSGSWTTSSNSPSTTSSPGTGATANTNTNQTSGCGAPPASAGKLQYAGVNIAGFDFGEGTDGSGSASAAFPPLKQYDGADGAGQMAHFVNDDKYNVFRLSVSWQFLTANLATGTLNQENFEKYNASVRACLATGASCLIDIHNYGRWDGQIIGQGGPSNEAFASLWGSIASHYVSENKVIFGIMNEPHDLPSLELWAVTVQAAVTEIREAGATMQMILIPGDNYSSAATFASSGSAAALTAVKNPDGTHTNLVFDVHRYLDSDNSGVGTSDTCVSNSIAEAWQPLTQWLRCHGRQAFLTETGGGNDDSCKLYMCQQLEYLAKNSDVMLGYIGWAAGGFSTTYTLSETPVENDGTWTDQPLVATCMAPSVNGLLA